MSKLIVSSGLTISTLLLGVQLAAAQTTAPNPPAANVPSVAPDNTKSNKNDPSNVNETADKQPNNAPDLELTRRIRSDVVADKTLSTYAHNVKILAVNGTVTLNGVVRSEAEKAEVGRKAASVAGKANVKNDLKIEAAK